MIYRHKTFTAINKFILGIFCLITLYSSTVLSEEASLKRGSVPIQNAISMYNGTAYDNLQKSMGAFIPKIIGGEDAKWDNHKWQAALLVSFIADPTEAHFCGGTLIRNDWVVTAAHCVDSGTLPQDINVLTGTANLNSGGKRGNVDSIYINKSYIPQNLNTDPPTPPTNDIALIKLKSDGIGQPINPISLNDEPSVVIAENFTNIAGWGATENADGSNTLKFIDVPLQSRSTCNSPASYDGRITDSMICAGLFQGGQDSCQGDSGGPSVRDNFLIGVVSWGDGCAEPFKFGVYTRVAVFTEWINACISDPDNCETK